MSLYDDIGIDKKDVGESKAAEWSSSFKLMQTQLQAKKVSAPLMQNVKRKVPTSLAPVVDLKRSSGHGVGGGGGGGGGGMQQSDGEIRFNPLTGRMETVRESVVSHSASPAFYGATNAPLAGINNEYDPQYPNEYEEFAKRLRDKRRQEKEEERKRDDEERARRRRERHKLSGYNGGGEREDEERDERRGGGGGGRSGAAIAPPSVLLEDTGKPAGQDPGPGGSVASKIMAKMGYRTGQGLGKEGQGMSMALQVEKVSKRGGKIIHEKDLPKDLPPPPAAPPAAPTAATPMTNAELLRNPSKVLLLTNMVGPGEVDADLQPETAEECSKYGKVNSCVVYELPDAPEIEAVRIFVEFDSIPSAIKAAIDTNGRYFGGRVVRSAFYDVDKFKNYQLADDPL